MPNLNAFPFDAVQTNGVYDREFTSDDFASYFGKFIGNGVYAKKGNCLEVIASSNNMYVTIRDGSAFINGRAKDWTSDSSLRLSNAHSTYDRYDLIVVRLDRISRDITLEIVEGVASASPVVPEVTQTDDVFELCLAQVRVRTGVTKIQQTDVTDRRSSSLCGWVSGLIDQIDARSFFEQYDNEFSQMYSAYETEFETWFNSIKNILGEDAVAVIVAEFEEFKKEINQAVANLPQYDLMMQTQTVAFLKNGWTKDVSKGYYVQTKTVTGLTTLSTPVISLDATGTKDEMVSQVTEWGKMLTHATGENTLTLYASEIPSLDLNVCVKTTIDTDVDALRAQLQNHTHSDFYTKKENDDLLKNKAPLNHASSINEYGLGNSMNFGHVKLSDNLTDTRGASEGVGASAKAVKMLNDEIVKATQFSSGTATLNTVTTTSGTVAWAKFGRLVTVVCQMVGLNKSVMSNSWTDYLIASGLPKPALEVFGVTTSVEGMNHCPHINLLQDGGLYINTRGQAISQSTSQSVSIISTLSYISAE